MVKWFATAIILAKQEKSKLRPNHWKRIREKRRKENDNEKKATGKQRTTTNVKWYTHGIGVIVWIVPCSMQFSSKLGCADDNDGRTVMTTMKNNDVCTTYNDAIDTNPMAKAHKFSVSHRKTETKRYDTETDCCFFFPFFEVLVLCTANCCCYIAGIDGLFLLRAHNEITSISRRRKNS